MITPDKNAAQPFLLGDSFAESLADEGLVVASVRFDLGHYQACWYPRLGIAMPDKVRGAVAKRQAEFLAGRYCAARALAALAADNTEVGSGDNRAPQWPVGTVGSISHTAGRALAVASFDQHCLGLGIDCETLIRPELAERLYDRIATDADSERWRRSEWSKEWFLTLLFAVKESLFKALYPAVGSYFGFDSARLLRLQDGEFSVALTRDLNRRWRAGAVFEGRYITGPEFAVTLLKLSRY